MGLPPGLEIAMKKIWLLSLFFFIVSTAAFAAPLHIVIGSGVRLRQTPSAKAQEIARLSFGAIAQELGKSETQETIGGKQNYWYQVSLQDGKTGWVFGAFLQPFQLEQKAAIYRDITRTRLQQQLGAAEYIDLTHFLTRAAGEVATPDVKAELELDRLIALRQSLELGQQQHFPQLDAWIAEQKGELEFHQLGACWFVPAASFWRLRETYNTLPIADDIAWQAVNAPTQGECEGFLPCHVSRLNQTFGRYLELYPAGQHLSDALAAIHQELSGFTDQTIEPYDRTSYLSLQSGLNRLRKIAEQVNDHGKDALIALLARLKEQHLTRK